MATPPFVPNLTIPGDTDIVSQFPGVDRTHIDIFNSWLLVNHSTQGRHFQVDIDQVGTTYGPSATPPSITNVSTIFRDTDGGMKVLRGDDSTVEWIGIPPGTVIDYAGVTPPQGYLVTNGQAVSRSTYARLFTAIGTTWGSGDGTTTFNIPDLQGRVTAGVDTNLGTRIAYSAVLGATGGAQYQSITQTYLPNVSLTFTGNPITIRGNAGSNLGDYSSQVPVTSGGSFNVPTGTVQPSFTPSGTISALGSGSPFPMAMSSAIVYKCIKY